MLDEILAAARKRGIQVDKLWELSLPEHEGVSVSLYQIGSEELVAVETHPGDFDVFIQANDSRDARLRLGITRESEED